MVCLDAARFDSLRAQLLGLALAAAVGTRSVACVALHANLLVEQAVFGFWESCHRRTTEGSGARLGKHTRLYDKNVV